MKEKIKIEVANEKNLPMYKALRSMAITGNDKEMFGSTPEMIAMEAARSDDEWREDMVSDDKFVVLAWKDDEAIGMGSAIKKPDGQWYIRSLYVKEAYRDNGIGKQIVKTRLNEIAKRNGKKILTHVRNKNKRSIHIMESFGFKKTTDDASGVGYFMERGI